jgi:hypothetical protein
MENEMKKIDNETDLTKINFFTLPLIKHYNSLNLNFWSKDQQIAQNYSIRHSKVMKLIEDANISKTSTEDFLSKLQKLKSQKLNLEKSYHILLNSNIRDKYLNFLFINFITSQPNSLEKLKSNFHYITFPYFIFILDNKKSNINADFMILDFPKTQINFYKKDGIARGVSVENINKIKKEGERIFLNLSGVEEVYFEAEVQQQRDLIYVLLFFMVKNREADAKKAEEHNLNVTYSRLSSFQEMIVNFKLEGMPHFSLDKLKLLVDESYLPSGIILKSFVSKKHKKRCLGYSTRYMILGSSNIIIFK